MGTGEGSLRWEDSVSIRSSRKQEPVHDWTRVEIELIPGASLHACCQHDGARPADNPANKTAHWGEQVPSLQPPEKQRYVVSQRIGGALLQAHRAGAGNLPIMEESGSPKESWTLPSPPPSIDR